MKKTQFCEHPPYCMLEQRHSKVLFDDLACHAPADLKSLATSAPLLVAVSGEVSGGLPLVVQHALRLRF